MVPATASASRSHRKRVPQPRRAPRPIGHPVENAEVARIFREVADLLEIAGANTFRIRAYRNAARVVDEHPEPVAALAREHADRLTELPGIGEDLAGKIVEIVRTGTLGALRDLERSSPPGAVELMRIPGLGPKRAKILCEKLGVRSIAGLERAARAGRIRTLRGFGAKTEERIRHELAVRAPDEQRVLRATAAQYGETLAAYLRRAPGVSRVDIAGSFRRCKETVGDLDVLVCARTGATVSDWLARYPEVHQVLAHGPTKTSVRLRSGLQVDVRVLPDRSFGAGLHYFTGSKPHNIAVRRLGQQRGLKINEYGIFRGARRVGGREEAEVFAAVGVPWIPPELREDRGELEAARAGKLPRLLELGDIRGDLQVHTTDSDGRDSLEAMADAALAMGYEYLAITDHTPSLRIAGGLDRAGFRRQMKRIDALNARLRGLTLLKGAEVDILADGSLDLDDATLGELDLVVVALHSRLDLAEAPQTARIVRALQHRSVDILAHPTGRLLGERHGATFDHDTVFRVAADHGVLLEINAQPQRLDLDDVAARAALAHGATLVVDTDAHSTAELRFMRWGVDQARRGWVEKTRVANTLHLDRLLALLHKRRR
jgi:DNA polymerase (family 10)